MALVHISLIWAVHVKLWERTTPKCLCVSTSCRTTPFIDTAGCRCRPDLLLIRSDLVLGSLKLTSHCSDHSCISCRSLLMFAAVWFRLSTSMNRHVSSANKRMFEKWIASVRSFMNIKNNRGPSIDPWGTPARILRQSENSPSKQTRCFLFRR